MRIHELAQQTGLTAPAIRFYEMEGLLDTRHVQRGENNYRDYDEGTVKHLRIIKNIQAAGFTLREIKALIQGEKINEFTQQEKIKHIRRKMNEIEIKKAELEQTQVYLAQMLEHKLECGDDEDHS